MGGKAWCGNLLWVGGSCSLLLVLGQSWVLAASGNFSQILNQQKTDKLGEYAVAVLTLVHGKREVL